MNLTLSGHDDRYAVEQLLLSLFPEDAEVIAVSELTREGGEIIVTSSVQANGVSAANTCWRAAPPKVPTTCCGTCISSPPAAGSWRWPARSPR